MNHDYAHCFDYEKEKCPKKCFRAVLTEDLKSNADDYAGMPTSWVHFGDTDYCLLKKESENNESV